MNEIENMSLRTLKKLYPMGSYCDIKTQITVSPCPQGYVDKARKRYSSTRTGGPVRVQLRTGKWESH